MTKIERVKQLRSQMLIHSYLYYWMDDPIWSDNKWQSSADELTLLQKEVQQIGWYDEAFEGWDGSTGHHLPKDEWVVSKALQIMRINDEIEKKDLGN